MLSTLTFVLVVTTARGFFVVDKNADEGCGSDYFPCDTNGCILKNYWCDSVVDCEDGSDEKYCTVSNNPDASNCTSKYFKCKNGRCIPKIGECDGEDSCGDASDERFCEHASTAYSEKQILTLSREPELQEESGTYHDEKELESSATPEITEIPPKVENTASKMTEITSENVASGTVSKMAEIIDENLQSTTVSKAEITVPIFHVSTIAATRQADLPNELSDENVQKRSVIDNLDLHLASTGAKRKESHFTELKFGTYKEELRNAVEWLMTMRDKDLSWGEYTSRALSAICLANPSFVAKERNAMLMIKQLHLQLALGLVRNDTKPIPLSDLALYVNALMATCSNPRNFHGMDLVAILRHRTDYVQRTGKFVSPSVYLTLCLGNSSSLQDISKMKEMMYSNSPSMEKMDVQALATLATLCMSRTTEWSENSIVHEFSRSFLQKVTSNGLPENIYELSLLVQALNEARIPENQWNRNKAIDMILGQRKANGSFGDILSTYYVLPILSGRSLVSVGRLCSNKNSGLIPLEILKNTKREKLFVRYTLRFGDPVEVTQSLQLKVPKGTSFFDIMRLAADIDLNFGFKYSIIRGQPVVYSIGNKANDAEKGMYWVLHVASMNSTRYSHTAYTGDIRQYYPEEADDSVFWLKALS